MSKWKMIKKLIFGLLISFIMSSVYAESHINHFSVYEKNDILHANVASEITFSKEVDDAIKRGLDLTFSYRFIFQSKKWWGKKSIATIRKNYKIHYNKTIKKFEIQNPITFEKYYFKNINDMIRKMEKLNYFPLINRKQLNKKATRIKVRFELDKSQLPTLLRLENIINNEWDIESNWKIWKLP